MEGFVKIDRRILDWEWYDDPNTMRLFFHCLLKANWKDARWHGMVIKAGQFVTSLPRLSEETQLTIHQVRTALSHLVETGEVADKSHSKFRVITVVKWNEYQADGRQVTDKWQTSGRQVATIEEYKEIKEEKNIYSAAVNQVIDYLNKVLGTKYSSKSKSTSEKITARLKEGHTFEDFKTVIDKKFKQWGDDPKMAKFLRPETLFAASHFESYLNEIEKEGRPKGEKPKFDSYTQRNIDYSELEKLISGN